MSSFILPHPAPRRGGPLRIWSGRAGALFCALLGLTAAEVRATGAAPLTLPQAEDRTVVSKAGLTYRLFIVRPQAPPPHGGYPVLYVLDGNAVAGLLCDLSRTQLVREGGLLDPAVLVAVGYPGDSPHHMPRRAHDLTPVPAPEKGPFTTLKPEETGGAAAFLSFLVDEVKLLIAADFPTDPTRQGLMGHSFGGLFTLYALFHRPEAFTTYIAASPSIWWGGNAILKDEAGFAAQPPSGHQRLLVTVGAYEQEPRPALCQRPQREGTRGDALARRLAERRMVDAARGLARRLAALPGAPVAVRFELLPGQTHMSTMPYGMLAGLEFLLGPRSAAETRP